MVSNDIKDEINQIIREEDYGRTRSLEELNAYAESVQDQIHENEDVRKASRLRVGRSKEFFQELRPLLLFLRYLVGRGECAVSVTPKLGNQSYDGLICFDDGHARQSVKVEVTEAIDGYDDSIRMELLNRDGHVSISGPMKRSGTKLSGRDIEIRNIAVSVQETADKTIALVENALERKSQKNYEPGTWLLVVFDDHMFTKEDRQSYLSQMQIMAKIYAESPSSPFQRVIIIGQTGRVHGDVSCTAS